jgi:hypothetical protein
MSENGISILITECELSKSVRLMTEGKKMPAEESEEPHSGTIVIPL